MKRKWLTGALVLAMAAVTLAGCGAKDETKEKVEQVTLNEVAHSIFYAPQYVAIEEGYFADEGIDLTLVTGFGADKTVTAVLAGEADIGFMGSESTIYTKNGEKKPEFDKPAWHHFTWETADEMRKVLKTWNLL